MAVNKPKGDNARKGAVKKRSQTKTTLAGASAWTKRNKSSGEFMALKRPGKKEEGRQKISKAGASRKNGPRKRPKRKVEKALVTERQAGGVGGDYFPVVVDNLIGIAAP
jgi:hypothetical protein